MKSLRNQASTNLGTVAASVLFAAFALTATGCSGAEGSELAASPVDSSADAVEADSSRGNERTNERAEPTRTETDDVETARAAQAQTSPSGYEAAEPSSEVTAPAQPSTDAEPTDQPGAPSTGAAPVPSNTLRVSGRQLLDTCGQPFVVRGVEQILGNQLPEGNDWLGLVRQIASTGANAVRILPSVNTLTLENVDEILTYIGEQGMVAFIDPLNGHDWYAQDDVRAMLKKHERFIIIDAYGEPQYDNIEQWRAEAKAALVNMRALGYEVPFTVYANQFGRGLPSLFDYGAEILAADPLHNTFLGWQAYWGNNNYYQEYYGYSLTEAVDAIVDSGLPIQMGLDHITDMPSTEADYGTLMQSAEENGVGWLWWDFYNPYGAENNLTVDGTVDNLTATGSAVLETHPASIANTAKLACGH
jgi:hypothetical protein